MDVYKGTGAFSGIAIGKILYYHKSEYQMRKYEITDVKTELNIFRQARTRVMEQLEDLYEKNCIIQGTQAEIFLRQKNLLVFHCVLSIHLKFLKILGFLVQILS